MYKKHHSTPYCHRDTLCKIEYNYLSKSSIPLELLGGQTFPQPLKTDKFFVKDRKRYKFWNMVVQLLQWSIIASYHSQPSLWTCGAGEMDPCQSACRAISVDLVLTCLKWLFWSINISSWMAFYRSGGTSRSLRWCSSVGHIHQNEPVQCSILQTNPDLKTDWCVLLMLVSLISCSTIHLVQLVYLVVQLVHLVVKLVHLVAQLVHLVVQLVHLVAQLVHRIQL